MMLSVVSCLYLFDQELVSQRHVQQVLPKGAPASILAFDPQVAAKTTWCPFVTSRLLGSASQTCLGGSAHRTPPQNAPKLYLSSNEMALSFCIRKLLPISGIAHARRWHYSGEFVVKGGLRGIEEECGGLHPGKCPGKNAGKDVCGDLVETPESPSTPSTELPETSCPPAREGHHPPALCRRTVAHDSASRVQHSSPADNPLEVHCDDVPPLFVDCRKIEAARFSASTQNRSPIHIDRL